MLRLLVYLYFILNELEVRSICKQVISPSTNTINSLKYKLPACVLVLTHDHTIMKNQGRQEV